MLQFYDFLPKKKKRRKIIAYPLLDVRSSKKLTAQKEGRDRLHRGEWGQTGYVPNRTVAFTGLCDDEIGRGWGGGYWDVFNVNFCTVPS